MMPLEDSRTDGHLEASVKRRVTPVRLTLVGYGDIARRIHGPLLAARPDLFQVRAICDPSTAARAFAAHDLPAATIVPSLDMAPLDEVDAALVLTSDGHAAPLRTLVAARTPILVEKPLCFAPAPARELCASARGVPLMVGYMKRYCPAVISLLNCVSLRTEPMAVDAVLKHPLPTTTSNAEHGSQAFIHWVDRAVSKYQLASALTPDHESPLDARRLRAYFLIITSVVHLLNLARAFVGATAVASRAEIAADGLSGELATAGDARTVRVRWSFSATHDYSEVMTIKSPAGQARIAFSSIYSRMPLTRVSCEIGNSRRAWASRGHGFREEHVALFDMVRHGRRPVTHAADALEDLCLALDGVSLAPEYAG
jgi:myo-inositol 2-dehydrogenase / D-chiro-inositol 1-dehydrogenase